VALGLQHPSVFLNDVSGWLPVNQIDAATARGELHLIRASMPRSRTGAVTSQGDFAQGTANLRTQYTTLTGSGVTVGVLSDSYNCYSYYATNGPSASGAGGYAPNGFTATAQQDIASGDLPATVTLVSSVTDGTTYGGDPQCASYGAPIRPPFGDEGRAMMQIVHDVAPGASLAFHTAENGEADFANGVVALAGAGAKVIVDDVGYFDEPFFQDGMIAQAIGIVTASGVAYFSSAGNDGHNAYENRTPAFTFVSTTAPNSGEHLLNFDTTGAGNQTSLSVSVPPIPPGDLMAIVVQWDQPYVTGAPHSPGASSHIDLCLTGGTGADLIFDGATGNQVTCTGPNTTGSDPVQVLIIDNPANAAGNSAAQSFNIQIGLADNTAPPGRIIVSVEDNGLGASIDPTLQTNSYTLQGHPNAASAVAVGAARFYNTPLCGVSPAALESYSSMGGAPILFDSSGNRLATAQLRQKPDVVGPDGGNDTFLGHVHTNYSSNVSQCANNTSYPNFLGTSAAAPHVAAIAALMLQSNPAITVQQIGDAIRKSADPMGSPTPNAESGFGFVQADKALALLPPGSPSLSFSAASVTAGGTTTLTWSSIGTTGCTASGGWSGSLNPSGSQTITAPMTTGTTAYTITCANAAGSGSATANLTITAAVQSSYSGGHGGGALGEWTLLALASLTIARALRRASSP